MVIKELIPLPPVLPFYNIFIREKVPVMFFVSRVDVKFPYLFFFCECVLPFSFQVFSPILDKEHECVCVCKGVVKDKIITYEDLLAP